MTVPSSNTPRALIIMGVSGSGKSTFGRRLAQELGAPFLEGDEFHPPENVRKMSAGIPLGDADRWPWLDCLANAAREQALACGLVVGSCSSLKRAYRDRIRACIACPVVFVFLDAPREELARRMAARHGHYMPVSLLESQLDALQRPEPDEAALCLDAMAAISDLLQQAKKVL